MHRSGFGYSCFIEGTRLANPACYVSGFASVDHTALTVMTVGLCARYCAIVENHSTRSASAADGAVAGEAGTEGRGLGKLLSPERRFCAAQHAREQHQSPERSTCQLLGPNRSRWQTIPQQVECRVVPANPCHRIWETSLGEITRVSPSDPSIQVARTGDPDCRSRISQGDDRESNCWLRATGRSTAA